MIRNQNKLKTKGCTLKIMLICDDDASQLRLYSRMLGVAATKLNCNVVQLRSDEDIILAANSNRLMAIAQNSGFIIKMMDIAREKDLSALFTLMTDGNLAPEDHLQTGHELILELRKRIPDLEAIMVTGNPEEFMDLGAKYGYKVFAKPVDWQELRNHLISFFSSG